MNKASDRPQPPALPPVDDEAAAELPYVVETGPAADPEAAIVLARLRSLAVAEATWEAAADERPGACVVLRHGDRILRRSGPA